MIYETQLICPYCNTKIKDLTSVDIKHEECYITKYAKGAHRYDGFRKYILCPLCDEKIIIIEHSYD